MSTLNANSAVTAEEKWEGVRSAWKGNKSNTVTGLAVKRTEIRGKPVDVEEVVESVFAGDSDGTLPQAIPLGQMVDILMDFWEADGFFE